MQRSVATGLGRGAVYLGKLVFTPSILKSSSFCVSALRVYSTRGTNASIHDASQNRNTRRSTSVASPHRCFTPPHPNSKPLDLFPLTLTLTPSPTAPVARLISTTDPTHTLLFAHGAHRKPPLPSGLGVYFSLEDNLSVPLAAAEGATYNSAQLHAVSTALRLRDWRSEGFRRVVVACSVPYVFDGVTGRLAAWEKNGWGTAEGVEIANAELWRGLVETMRALEKGGVEVRFWMVGRSENMAVDLAEKEMVPDETETRVEAKKKKKKRRSDPKRQMAGFLIMGGAGLMVGVIAIKFGY